MVTDLRLAAGWLSLSHWLSPRNPGSVGLDLTGPHHLGALRGLCWGGGGWPEATGLGRLWASRHLYIPTLCGSKRGLVVSTEPLDDLSCLTTPG